MTTPLTWNLHGNDQLSGVLEKLDRTISQLSRRMNLAAGDARQYGRAMAGAQAPTTQFSARLTETGSRLEGVTSKVVALGTAFRTLLVTAGVAMAAAAASAGAFGIKMAAANEDAAISFELMLGSAKKAKDFLEQLQSFAAATPFEMPQLRAAASRLLAVGTQAKDIIPILTALGDATAGMGTGAFGIERAVTALTQMRQKTKVTGEEMMQLTEAGIPAWETLAATLRVSVAKAMDMVSKRQVDAGVIFEAIQQRAGAGMQRLTGMMQRQSLTLTGIWSTFKDNAGQALAKFMEPAMPGIKKLVEMAGEAVPKVLGFFTNLRERIGAIFTDSPVGGQILDSLREMGQKLLPSVKRAFDMVVDTVRENKDGLEKFGRFLADVVIPAGGKLIEALTWITLGFVSLSAVIAAHVVPAMRFLVTVANDVFGMIVHGAAAAFGWLPGLGDDLKKNARDWDIYVANINAALDRIDGKTVDVTVKAHYQSFGSAPTNIPHQAGPTQNFDQGGMVQGPYGSPQLVLAHAGERVLTPAQQRDGGGVLGYLVVKHEYPDADRNRTELLALKRNRGWASLGLS